MASVNAYRKLASAWSTGFASIQTWLADDHLLLVSIKFFNEEYTRLYWADIQMLMLYQLERSSPFMLVFEWLCIVAPLVGFLSFGSQFRGPGAWSAAISALVFALAYASWRFTRPAWACRITTKTNEARIPIGRTLIRARAIFADLQSRVALAQPGAQTESAMELLSGIADNRSVVRKPPFLVLHGLTFGIGLVAAVCVAIQTPTFRVLGGIFAFFLYLGLVAVYFVQQDLEFPFAVKTAAIMSQIAAFASLAGTLVLFLFFPALASFYLKAPMRVIVGSVSLMLRCFFGIVAIFALTATRQEPTARPVRRGMLGLE